MNIDVAEAEQQNTSHSALTLLFGSGRNTSFVVNPLNITHLYKYLYIKQGCDCSRKIRLFQPENDALVNHGKKGGKNTRPIDCDFW